jgi:hypothetical protein
MNLLPALLLTADPNGPVAEAGGIAVDRRGVIYIADAGKNIVCWQVAK